MRGESNGYGLFCEIQDWHIFSIAVAAVLYIEFCYIE